MTDKKDYKSKKRLSVYRLHVLQCQFIPEGETSETERDVDIQNRIILFDRTKRQKRKYFLFFVCPYDGCMQTYYSFRYPGAIEHLDKCKYKDDVKKLAYMKQKKMI